VQAVNDALHVAMREDPRVVVLGEDVGRLGGVFRATLGLHEAFGPARVVDTPLAENGIVGAAIGMALYGLRPVAEIQFADFVFPAFEQLVNELAKLRYRSGGEYPCPVVVRMPYGGGVKGGHYHSQSPEAYFAHTPGLVVVAPATAHDAKGLLLAALRQPDPVIFLEPKRSYRAVKDRVPPGAYAVPLGKARVAREGRDVTVVAWGAMVPEALLAAEAAEARGLSVEVLDLRTLWPLDVEGLLASVERTGRAVVVHEAPRTCGLGAEIAALLQERLFTRLLAPVARVTGWDTPVPYALESEYLPRAPRILEGLTRTCGFVA
jgi:2-oxoisovalerate dehydrogenase E1 component beta subunit